jgi:hypothetical protein
MTAVGKARRSVRAEDRPITSMTRSKKKPRAARVPLTHLEVRRGDTLRARIAMADDALGEAGDELGALLKKLAPGTRTSIVEAPIQPEVVTEPTSTTMDIVISRHHNNDDEAYHATVHAQLVDFFGALCDESLADALEIARAERERRAEGRN